MPIAHSRALRSFRLLPFGDKGTPVSYYIMQQRCSPLMAAPFAFLCVVVWGVALLGFVLRLPPSYGCRVSLCSSDGYSLKWDNMQQWCIDMTVFCEGISAMWKMCGVLNGDKRGASCSRWTVVQALRSFVALRMTYYV